MTDLSDLTPRQLDVAMLVVDGATSKVIAARLGVGERWVRCVITSIAYRIGADCTKDDRVLVALWVERACAAYSVSADRQEEPRRAS